jgi:hypothetical protein
MPFDVCLFNNNNINFSRKNNRRYSPQDDPDNSVQFSAVDEADALQEQSLLAASASEDA